jgi:NhaA family Na+:H+ antiporter
MRKSLPFLIVIAVGLLALGSGTLLYRARRPAVPASASNSPTPAPEADKTPPLHVRGGTAAPVTLEEFGDFQCPPCGAVASSLKQLEKDFGVQLRVVFYEFPLAMHEHAREAAFAAEAAGLQNRFWEMHDLLYEEQTKWSKAPDVPALFQGYAATLGLNVDRFIRDMDSEEVKARVTADQELGKSRGVQSTPTLFINNELVPVPSLNPDGLRAAIDKAVKEKPAP